MSYRNELEPDRLCPHCESPLYGMGKKFKPPPQSDKTQWRKVQALRAHGFMFVSARGLGEDPMPRTLREVEEFVRTNPNHSCKVAPPRPELVLRSRER